MNERRISDRERERTVELLREHAVMGTLPPEDLTERSRAALLAQTAADLEQVTRDLPDLPDPPVTARLAERVSLRTHIVVYLIANALFVVLWLVTRKPDPNAPDRSFSDQWPFWVAVFWGFLLAGHALLRMRRTAVRRAERRRESAG